MDKRHSLSTPSKEGYTILAEKGASGSLLNVHFCRRMSRLFSLNMGDDMAKIETIAFGDGCLLLVALGLRLLVLYPTFAAYVCIETEHIDARTGGGNSDHAAAGETISSDFDLRTYSEAASLCFKKTAPWLALLHFQTVLIVAAVEVLTLPIIHRAAFGAEV
ncbi:hypothetical protein E4T42_03039 [Aureobasidium subglaciale]|nr:hypothetical protein E4T42_03039 [Aureobasidium subglaciale]